MDKALKSQLSSVRRMLENPYAHLEYFDDAEVNNHAVHGKSSISKQAREKLSRLQNPHAFSDQSITVSKSKASSRKGPTLASSRYQDCQIEEQAYGLLNYLWQNRHRIWANNPPADPIDVIDSVMALSLKGFSFVYQDDLGDSFGDGGATEIAGLIDGDTKTVKISSRFSEDVQTFTAAHELGHAVLHNPTDLIHRDRPANGEKFSRDPIEREADKFASYFLMPKKILEARFIELFGTGHISLNEEIAFALCGKPLIEVRKECRELKDFSRLVAGANNFHEQPIQSLANQFRVSVQAMAIRLEELNLIEM